jgi:mRNA interferase RelE/StbE
MAEYSIEVSATAERQIMKLSERDQQRVINVIKKLGVEPRPRGCRKLQAYDDIYRVRTGVFRILYSVEDDRLLVLVLKVGHRKGIYR